MNNSNAAAAMQQFDGGLAARPAGRILVATSDGSYRLSVASFLASRGYSFVIAPSGQDALVHLEAGGFDLVVTAMRDADSFELLRQVRRTMPGLPVIMIAPDGGGIDGVQLDCAAGLRREAIGAQVSGRLASLTSRERQVFDLVVAGRANKVIAYELSISPRTVENHRARLMDKLRVKSVAELVRLALGAEALAAPRAAKIATVHDTGGGSRLPVTA